MNLFKSIYEEVEESVFKNVYSDDECIKACLKLTKFKNLETEDFLIEFFNEILKKHGRIVLWNYCKTRFDAELDENSPKYYGFFRKRFDPTENQKYLYTDGECLFTCLKLTDFETIKMDRSILNYFDEMLKNNGRKFLWDYCRQFYGNKFKNDSPEYYGFFGKKFDSNENQEYLYTDDECIKVCLEVSVYCGHNYSCTHSCYWCNQLRESELLEKYLEILNKYGRKFLWEYCNRKYDDKLKNDSSDYYGFFGKKFDIKKLYTDEECTFACLKLTNFISGRTDKSLLKLFGEILNKYGRKFLWEYCNRRYDNKLKNDSSDYYGFFGKKFDPTENQEYLYTDEECTFACLKLTNFISEEKDKSLMILFEGILNKDGREFLWEYCNRRYDDKLKNDSPDYYGFFGKKFDPTENQEYLYTDEECIFTCLKLTNFVSEETDKSLLMLFDGILKKYGRKFLWEYCNRRYDNKLKDDSSDYYGFFGKKFDIKKLYTDEECTFTCLKLTNFVGEKEDKYLLSYFDEILKKYGRKALWDYCKTRFDKILDDNSPEYYGFFGKKFDPTENKDYLYTDEECIFTCLKVTNFVSEVTDKSFLMLFDEILNKYGRKVLWVYCKSRFYKVLDNNSSDYYGFFGKKFDPIENQEYLYTDEECIFTCLKLMNFISVETDKSLINSFNELLKKYGRKVLWDYCKTRFDKVLDDNSPEYYGFFGKKFDLNENKEYLYTDEECIYKCLKVAKFKNLEEDESLLKFFDEILKTGRKFLWEYCNSRFGKKLKEDSLDYYGFFGTKTDMNETHDHLYSDEECIFACLYKNTYHNVKVDKKKIELYSEIINHCGRKGLWIYYNRRYDNKLKNDSPDYYGFFGQNFNLEEDQEHIYTDEECVAVCFSLYLYDDVEKLIFYLRLIHKFGRQTLWDLFNQQKLGTQKLSVHSPDYYGFFGEYYSSEV